MRKTHSERKILFLGTEKGSKNNKINATRDATVETKRKIKRGRNDSSQKYQDYPAEIQHWYSCRMCKSRAENADGGSNVTRRHCNVLPSSNAASISHPQSALLTSFLYYESLKIRTLRQVRIPSIFPGTERKTGVRLQNYRAR